MALAQQLQSILRVKLILEESTMQNQVFEIVWAKPPGVFDRGQQEEPFGYPPHNQTRLIGDVMGDWHGICNNAGCPTIVDWQAI